MEYLVKFRLEKILSFKKNIEQLRHDLELFIIKLAYKYCCPVEGFVVWKGKILEKFSHNLSIGYEFKKFNKYIRINNYRELVENLRKKFIITIVDKADNALARKIKGTTIEK